MSSAAQEAAAVLVPEMVAQLVESMPVQGDDVLAADLAASQGNVATPETVSSSQPQTAQAAAPATEQAAPVEEEAFDLEPVIPDELQALLDEPDFEAEAAAEVADAEEEWDEDATDPEVAKRLKTLEKRNAWLEEQRVKTEKTKWVAENLKAYPLLSRFAADEVKAIDATSRRAFARQAASMNTRLAAMLKPALEEIQQAKQQLRGQAQQEVRGEYKQAWGTITTGPAAAPVEQSAYEAEIAEAQKTGQLHKVIGVMMRAAGVKNE